MDFAVERQSMSQRFSATITNEDELPLPREVRDRLGLAKGSTVTFLLEDDAVIVLPSAESIERLFGSVPALGAESEDFDDEIEDAIEHALATEHS
jgi:bifunctional DNA-binding transcriptional regulator/antitoxin component of YhaV-PrlF toxin-antitoxin module